MAGWVRFKDVADVINEKVDSRNKANVEMGRQQQEMLEEMKLMLYRFGDRITNLESTQHAWEEIPRASKEDIYNLFRVEGRTLILGNGVVDSAVGQNDVGN